MRVSGNKPQSWLRRFAVARLSGGLLLALLTLPMSAASSDGHQVTDLFYGEALYQYFQENELAAITRLLVARDKPLRRESQQNESNLLLADLFYGYGLHEESRQLFAQLLDTQTSSSIQNRIWFNLARLRYRQGYSQQASNLLTRIDDSLPKAIEAERKYLLTNLSIDNGQYQQASQHSTAIASNSIWKVYARYNLAVALLDTESYPQGRKILDQIGQIEPDDEEFLALRDLANLSLGLKQLRIEAPDEALQSLSRVRLDGPLSNQALLASGWAWYRLQQFDKAQVPWQYLLRRNAIDPATQEAILAIPANYAESGEDRLAIQHYKIAAQQFDRQLQMLQEAIRSIEQQELIAALQEHAILHDRDQLQRLPPDSKVTPQLHLLLASSGFHREIRRYQELIDIRESLGHWGDSFPTLDLMLAERRQAFAANLPKLQETGSFARLETLNRQRDEYAAELDRIRSLEDYQALAQPEEQEQLQRLQRVAGSIDRIAPQRGTEYQQDMLRLLSGLLNYRMETEYPARLWRARKQLRLLDRGLELANSRMLSLNQIKDKTDFDFTQFEIRISGQLEKIDNLRNRVDRLLRQQEAHINQLAVEAIRTQQQHIVQLRLNARYELARLYDRLATEQ